MNPVPDTPDVPLIEKWRRAWPQALQAWSRYTRLRDPLLCPKSVHASQQGLEGSFAMIRLADQSVVVDLQAVVGFGLEDYAVEILAHEIGHHVLAPATAADHFRLIARLRRGLPTLERHAALVANLYTDLLINDRLHRQSGMRMADIYSAIAGKVEAHSGGRVWPLYMRIYEHLWRLEPGSLGGACDDQQLDSDAWLGARLVRVYAGDWMAAAGSFAALLLPYLAQDTGRDGRISKLQDTHDAGKDCEPGGVHDIGPDEASEPLHPVHDQRITGSDSIDHEPVQETADASRGQAREPYEYGEILKAAGLRLNDHDIAVRYYRAQALPHLVRFPQRRFPGAPEELMEGIEPWNVGDPFDEIDWMQSAIVSPRPIAGLTTMRRSYGEQPGIELRAEPVDLDMYVDSSGSMPNPQMRMSYLALSGAIIALSALRGGARVQVTLWSGKNQTIQTQGFVRDEDAILRVLTGFFGGATCFPIHVLRDTYAVPRKRATHILMISDDGITTMFDRDERGNNGWDVAARALERGNAGGTMALNLPPWARTCDALRRAEQEQRWAIHAISEFKDLVGFARAFSRMHYGARNRQEKKRSHG